MNWVHVAVGILCVTMPWPPVHGDIPTVAEVARMYEEIEKAHETFTTTLTITVLPPQPISSDLHWNNAVYLDCNVLRVTHRGIVRRHEVFDCDGWQLPGVTPKGICMWDGASWTAQDLHSRSRTISAEPECTLRVDCLPLFNLCSGPSVGMRRSISENLRQGKLVSQSEDGSRLTYEFSLEEGTRNMWKVTFDREPVLRLLSVQQDLSGRPGDKYDKQVKARVVFMIDEWAVFDGVLMPQRAHRDGFLFHSNTLEAKGVDPQVGRVLFERFSRTDPDRNAQLTIEEIAGERVDDSRYRIQYVVGAKRLSVDGFDYLVESPVSGDPGPMLPNILDGSVPTMPSLAREQTEWSPLDRRPVLRAIGYGALTFAGLTVCACVMTRRRNEVGI